MSTTCSARVAPSDAAEQHPYLGPMQTFGYVGNAAFRFRAHRGIHVYMQGKEREMERERAKLEEREMWRTRKKAKV